MFVKLSFEEKTLARCMDLRLLYMLAREPEIIDTLPANMEANKQVRVPDSASLNEMFGPFNSCHYDYYLDCGDASKETINRVIKALSDACDGKLPQLEADEQYLADNENLVVYALKCALDEVRRDKDISNELLLQKVKTAFLSEAKKHAMQSMHRFFAMLKDEDSASEPDVEVSESPSNKAGK